MIHFEGDEICNVRNCRKSRWSHDGNCSGEEDDTTETPEAAEAYVEAIWIEKKKNPISPLCALIPYNN